MILIYSFTLLVFLLRILKLFFRDKAEISFDHESSDDRSQSPESESNESHHEMDSVFSDAEMYATESFPSPESFHGSLLARVPLKARFQGSSFFTISSKEHIKPLASFVECTSEEEIENLLLAKIKQCCIMFDFNVPTSDMVGKEIKRASLNDLINYVQTADNDFLTDSVYHEIFKMFEENAFRIFPSFDMNSIVEPDEEEVFYEVSWPHLSLVYEFVKTVLESNFFNPSVASQYISEEFLFQLVELFNSRDYREREYLKSILHRLYSCLFTHRSFLRQCMSGVFIRFIYENEPFNGISCLLDIYSSIIHGFALPLKDEHTIFLKRVLLPLHKGRNLRCYHEQLQMCVLYFVIKDDSLGYDIISYIIKNWPKIPSFNQILFMNEIDKIVPMLQPETLKRCIDMIFGLFSKLILNDHFQVVEAALIITKTAIFNLNQQFAEEIIRKVYSSIDQISKTYWNGQISILAKSVLKILHTKYDKLCTSLQSSRD